MPAPARLKPKKYALDFSVGASVEIDALVSGVLQCFDPEKPQLRRHWWAVAQMALGKAQMLRDGLYGTDDPDIQVQAEELQEIVDTILEKFKLGDGQI